jgi:hypothetical protein
MIVYVTTRKLGKKKKNIRNADGKYNEKFSSIIFNKNYDEIKKFH